MNLLAEQTSDEFDHRARGEAAVVQKRIELDQIELAHQALILKHLHHQMRLAIGRPARHRGADAGG